MSTQTPSPPDGWTIIGTETSRPLLATQYRTRYNTGRDGKSAATVWHLLARRAGVQAAHREMYVADLGHRVVHGTHYALRQYDPASPEGSAILRLVDEAEGWHPDGPYRFGDLMPSYRIFGYRTGPDPLNRDREIDPSTRPSANSIRDLFLAAAGSTEHRRVAAWTIHPDRNYPDGILVAHTSTGDKVMFDPRVFAAAYDITGPVDVHPRKMARVYARDEHTVDAVVMPIRHPAATWAD